ncbi:MAG TPA: hypothetical protein VMF58_00935 [Rhizomicrobium sp.]|nr:hypothetical protein [Rhizomicrobium sp.]
MRAQTGAILLALVLSQPACAQWSFFHIWQVCSDKHYDPDRRIAACQKVVQTEGLSTTEIAYAYLDMGDAYDDKKDAADSLAALNKAIEVQPLLWQAYVDRIPFLLERGDHAAANADFETLEKIDPLILPTRLPNIGYGSMGVEPNTQGTADEEKRQYDLAVAKLKAQLATTNAPDEISRQK